MGRWNFVFGDKINDEFLDLVLFYVVLNERYKIKNKMGW